LTRPLCIEGNVEDLPQYIEVMSGFLNLLSDFLDIAHCGVWSSMIDKTLEELLHIILP